VGVRARVKINAAGERSARVGVLAFACRARLRATHTGACVLFWVRTYKTCAYRARNRCGGVGVTTTCLWVRAAMRYHPPPTTISPTPACTVNLTSTTPVLLRNLTITTTVTARPFTCVFQSLRRCRRGLRRHRRRCYSSRRPSVVTRPSRDRKWSDGFRFLLLLLGTSSFRAD